MKREGGGAARESSPITIGVLSRATRIPVETLRTWERRYGAPTPVRKPSGHRLYPAATVEHLRRVARLLARGHRPGEVLALPVRELDALLALSEPGDARTDGEPRPGVAEAPEHTIATLIEAAGRLDRDALLRELRSSWSRLGPLRFLDDVCGPFLTEIGRAWARKALEVRHEHFASACVAGFLREAREPFDHDARGPRVAAAMLPGEQHEGGLLMACVVLARRGCRVVYLGADTPIDQIAAAAGTGDIEAVAVSVSPAMKRRRAADAVERLRAAMPRRVPLWLGGGGAPPPPAGAERFETLEAFDARVASVGARPVRAPVRGSTSAS